MPFGPLALAVVVWANLQSSPADTPEPVTEDPAADGDDALSNASLALALSVEAQASFLRGELAVAARLLRQAYALDPLPPYLLARAIVHQDAGDCEEALRLYRTYLDLGARKDAVTSVRKHIAECEQALAARPAPEPTAAASTSPTPAAAQSTDASARRTPDRLGFALVASGAVATGAGAALFIGGAVAARSARRAPDEAEVDRFVRRSNVLVGVGLSVGALGLAGGIIGAIRLARSRRPARSRLVESVSSSPMLGGAMVTWSGRW